MPTQDSRPALFRCGEGGWHKSQLEPLPETVELEPEAEALLQGMNLSSPDIIQQVRWLLLPGRQVAAEQAGQIVSSLMGDSRAEAKRAAADLLGGKSHVVRLFILRRLPEAAGDQAEYFLSKIQGLWGSFGEKEVQALGRGLPQLIGRHGDDPRIVALIEDLTVRMIEHPGKLVPLAGINAAQAMGLKNERITAALETQRTNEVYDYFANEHPVRKAALEALGETYTPPEREMVDYAALSIVRQAGREKPEGLSVGLVTSLYTAEGPCIGGGDRYGWEGQCFLLWRLRRETDMHTFGYLHPVTEVARSPLIEKLKWAGASETVLNSASVEDLSLCDVVILSSCFNLRAEVVDALEEFVWNGGGLVTLSGAGIVAAEKGEKLSALQDMDGLQWGWSTAPNETLVAGAPSPLTEGIDLSIPFPHMNRNGYSFAAARYKPQILLRFRQLNEPALRVSTYGKGRIAHFAWGPELGDHPEGDRNWELLRRVLLWAGGTEYKDYRPAPVFFRDRYRERS